MNRFTCSLFSLAECAPDCQNGGICTQPNICNCSGTEYEGDLCQTGVFHNLFTFEYYIRYRNITLHFFSCMHPRMSEWRYL